jgi:pilus assembly protein CpaB
MNRQTRTLIVLAVAVAMAGVAAYLVYRVVTNIPIREVEVARRFQVVAAKNLGMGTRIAEADVKVVAWPEDAPVEGGFSEISQVVGRGVLQTIVLNEPVVQHKLAAPEAGAGLPPTIKEGMRALSLRVNDVVGVAGYVLPGTKVDVLVTLREQPNAASNMTRVVVDNVHVLAAGKIYDTEQGRQGQAIDTAVVTLMLTPEQAEKVALAASEGQILLTLRNPLDAEPTVSPGARRATLFSRGGVPVTIDDAAPRPRVSRAVAPPPPPPPPPPKTVEAIRGQRRSNEPVKPVPPVGGAGS